MTNYKLPNQSEERKRTNLNFDDVLYRQDEKYTQLGIGKKYYIPKTTSKYEKTLKDINDKLEKLKSNK